jgi:hypothetical protein
MHFAVLLSGVKITMFFETGQVIIIKFVKNKLLGNGRTGDEYFIV